MSAAGTPSTDPWVILARERARYEEQFKSLKPTNGVVTGEQAKGFFLQSQLPPLILGQIWALADTDSDGKMDINEFSIACKLINLKLRGFEIPKGLPSSLLASLKVNTPPAIPPLPNPALIGGAPGRPEPPKIASQTTIQNPPLVPPQPLMNAHPLIGVSQPLIPGITTVLGSVPPGGAMPPATSGVLSGNMPIGMMTPASTGIPTGIVPPMQGTMKTVQPLIGGIPPMTGAAVLPSQAPITSQPLLNMSFSGFGTPLVPGISAASTLPSSVVPPLVSTTPLLAGTGNLNNPPVSAVPTIPVGQMSPVGVPAPSAGPGATSTPRASIGSLDRTASIESMSEWAVPHQTKLKYTQIFNTTDRSRTGYLSGAQARNVMVQTKLPQNTLAQIWALSDMDGDGRLGTEEFVLAMHLCEQAHLGNPPPAKLLPDLIPPSFRRPARTASISSQGSAAVDPDQMLLISQNSFEDKRKENYEKGQAELERRRKTLLDQQRKEAEERERKEREELERKEKARQEAERKRMEELEKQMRDQQEKERLLEEERKRQAEQREAARREMERQRQLEWEKQRLQELQHQRQREQENVLKLKAKNQSLTIELSSLDEQVKELSQKICDTRVGVSNVKTTIDGMRSTRDTQMQEMSQIKNKLKDQNAKLLALSQEKARIDAKNKVNTQDSEQARLAFENKDITIKNLKEKIADMQSQIDSKLSDIENNNTQLKDLKTQLSTLVSECENLYGVYQEKRNQVLEMKNANRTMDYDNAWKSTEAWSNADTNVADEWPAENNWSIDDNTVPLDLDNIPGVHKYRAIYEFVARNNDEISFQPGDIIHVPEQQTGEPGWLAGEIRGHTGWFPESYVEPVDGIGIQGSTAATAEHVEAVEDAVEATKLEGITEVPETVEPVVTAPEPIAQLEGEPEYYIANYAYQSQEPGDLTFNAGDVIGVFKKDGDWWTGKLNDSVGIFPSNYVQKVDVSTPAAAAAAAAATTTVAAETPPTSTGVSAEAVTSALENVQAASSQSDNEVSQINEFKQGEEKPLDYSITSTAQCTGSFNMREIYLARIDSARAKKLTKNG